jgi:hypothetical protein
MRCSPFVPRSLPRRLVLAEFTLAFVSPGRLMRF